jgi:geranylgeranyl reductase family protein
MDRCDALIVGAGPAGSACAWRLCRAGLDVVVLDRQRFPRDKVCGGWITLAVLEELEIQPEEYARRHICQPIRGFRVGAIGKAGHEIAYDQVISYGIRRCEFDAYLACRSGARLKTGVSLTHLERTGGEWMINHEIRAPLVIGAGGHFCPVARFLGAKSTNEIAVAAQEVEFAMDAAQSAQIPVRGEMPELYFCDDLRGYGWIFRKQNYLNIGLGRIGERRLAQRMSAFVEFLTRSGRLPFVLPARPAGHAYLLHGDARRKVVADGVLLIGDAAGLAYSQSGEGIRPAVESGLLAAKVILGAGGEYTSDRLQTYRERLVAQFGNAQKNWASQIGHAVSPAMIRAVARPLLASRWFARHVILDRWFLHRDQQALAA